MTTTKTWKEVKENLKNFLQNNVNNAWNNYSLSLDELKAIFNEIERLEDRLLGR